MRQTLSDYLAANGEFSMLILLGFIFTILLIITVIVQIVDYKNSRI